MSELSKMLIRIINDNGNFVSKEQAEKSLSEYDILISQKNFFKDAAKYWMEMHDTLKEKQKPIKSVEYEKSNT